MFPVSVYCLLLSALLKAALAQRINSLAGPYRLVVGHLDECPPQMQPLDVYHVVTYTGIRDRVNKDVWWYSANLTSFVTADDNYTAVGNLASWNNVAGWKENFFQASMPNVCTAAKTHYRLFWRQAMKRVFNDPDKDCPFPPGFYSVSNVSTNHDIRKPPVFFYGKYRATGQIIHTRTGTIMSCYRGYFALVPRTKQSQ
ncbi:uncharacterized protein LOC113215482 [Frankliniella occidentalis]|uniref:Uncharacterized protein LOC113215482 n=1 Tax=Frankliniella occidentalis TaxID=133901 RepID=A0A6J1TDS3_FRAOC|nr:uncharacterized protein LOC113215482 [Frankliniella occidentalis]